MKDIITLQQVVYETTALCGFKNVFSKWGYTYVMTGGYWVMDCKLCGPTLGPLILATGETRQI
jgi:hypothetical protein